MIEILLRDFYRKNNLPYSYCEFYTCCCQTPCKYNSEYQKTHDFDFDLPIKDDQKYIFLYRKNKIEQLEAYYRYIHKTTSSDYTSKSEYNNLIQFCNDESYYYDELVEKYANPKRDNILCVDYNEFVNDPHKEFCKIIAFVGFNSDATSIDQFPEIIVKRRQLDDNLMNKILNDVEFIING